MNGWMGKIIKVDLSTGKQETIEIDDKIRRKYNYICCLCSKNQKNLSMKNKNGKIVQLKLCIHHIDYNKKNCNENNLIPLCRKCNASLKCQIKKHDTFNKAVGIVDEPKLPDKRPISTRYGC